MGYACFPIALIKYSGTCPSEHLYKATSCLMRPTSGPQLISFVFYLYNATTCLTRPATAMLCPKNSYCDSIAHIIEVKCHFHNLYTVQTVLFRVITNKPSIFIVNCLPYTIQYN